LARISGSETVPRDTERSAGPPNLTLRFAPGSLRHREQEIEPERSTLFPASTGHDVQGRLLIPKVHAALLALVDADSSASPRMVERIYTAG
jgi:hypothetical protein